MPRIHQLLVRLLLLSLPLSGLASTHAFDVRDSIEMARFSTSDPTAVQGMFRISPDGNYVVFLTSRGVIRTNSTESSLWLLRVKEVEGYLAGDRRSAPQPRLLARIAAVPETIAVTAYAPVITQVEWASDSRSVLFIGQDSHGEHHLFRVELASGHSIQLSPRRIDVLRYATDRNTIAIKAFISQRHTGSALDDDADRGNKVATGMRLSEILFPELQESPQATGLWLIRNGVFQEVKQPKEDQREAGLSIENAWDTSLAVSSRNNLIVWLAPIQTVDSSWFRYRPAVGSEHLVFRSRDDSRTSPSSLNRVRHYVITDARTGGTYSLVDAPMGRALGYATRVHTEWSRDGRYLLLTNTFLPLTATEEEPSRRETPCEAARYEIDSRKIECVLFSQPDPNAGSLAGTLSLKDAMFGNSDDEILIRTGRPGHSDETTQYRRTDRQWIQQVGNLTASAQMDEYNHGQPVLPIGLRIQENLNEPPTLWASDKKSGRSKELWDPNPQFHSMQLGRVTVYQWKDKSGYQWTGGLVWPLNYKPGNRYPLVIQIYQFRSNEFMTDGTEPTAMAARPTGSAGMFFLQVSRKPIHSFDAKEADDHLEGMLSAIDGLDAAGLIEPKRVGVIGFSWTCWYVENALIKAPNRFAAATLADGPDNSYMQYRIVGAGNPVEQATFERVNGGPPIGDNLLNWARHASSFNLDKVQTPLRIEAIRPTSLLAEWEIYSSLWQQGKPVDLIYIPNGQHILQKPQDRLFSQQGNIDWFKFWLNPQEAKNTIGTDEYSRWSAMRPHVRLEKAAPNDDTIR